MTVIGHGLDVVDRRNYANLDAESIAAWEEETFSAQELAEVDGSNTTQRLRKLSGKFAAKEAVYKALGGTQSGEIAWREIEVLTESSGRPRIRSSGDWLATCQAAQVLDLAVSISHTESFTFASAIALATDL